MKTTVKYNVNTKLDNTELTTIGLITGRHTPIRTLA